MNSWRNSNTDFKKEKEVKMKRLVGIFLIVGLLAGTAGLRPLFAEGKKPKVIRIASANAGGYGKPFSFGTIGVAHVKGLIEEEFKNDGIKIEWYMFALGGPATNEAFANGTIDFGAHLGSYTSVIPTAAGIKIRLIAADTHLQNFYLAVPYDSPINSIKDLKGKKIGITKGAAGRIILARVLDSVGLKEKDVKLINLFAADTLNALAAKDIDAGNVGTTGGFALRRQGVIRIFYGGKDVPLKWRNVTGLFVTEKFANEYPDIVKRVVKAYVKAAYFESKEENRQETIAIWCKRGDPIEDVKEDFAGLSFKRTNSPLLDEFHVAHYKRDVDFAFENGMIKRKFDVDKWVDRSYLDAALKELGLENYWSEYDEDGNEIKK
jgi:sulfonate transport system substrate-binding protein